MDVTLAPMRWWHIPAVHAIETECFTVDPWSVEQFWEELAQPTRTYRVAMRGGEVIGYAGIFQAGADADIQTIAVHPGEQRHGIGRMLVQELVTAAHQAGATSLLLEVRADNTPAISMYRDESFEQVSVRTRYYPDGSDALLFRRSV
jgi:ribosomal-protein-alanine N-acetyltransferase